MSELLGLRGRLTMAMLAVSALTLVITSLLLLFPLDRKLRQDVRDTLTRSARTAAPVLANLPADAFAPDSPRLLRAARDLRTRTGADAYVFDASGRRLVGTENDSKDSFPEVRRALADRRAVSVLGRGDGEAQAQVAIPFTAGGRRLVLDLRKDLRDLNGAQSVVSRSLIAAALVALAVALVAGIVLASRLVRRLSALRDATVAIAEHGPGATVLNEAARDEVGDLGRAFATMQHQLEAQEQARRTFVSTASHELRTPLTSLGLMLHGAHEELGAPRPDLAEARQQVARALIQTERLGRLAAELLDLSRMDAGLELRAEPVELGELARSVVAEFPGGQSPSLVVPQPVWALTDPGAVARIMRILIDNARRHAGPAGSVTVTVGRRDETPQIAVADSGPGVADADAERIFARFERGPGAAEDGGFGLGLAIGRELARQAGGDLRLCDERPGATFAASFPPSQDSA